MEGMQGTEGRGDEDTIVDRTGTKVARVQRNTGIMILR